MAIPRRLALGFLWLLSLVAVAATAHAQRSLVFSPLPEPKVISGSDLGFRVEGMVGDQPAGAIVVRVNGKWLEVTSTPRSSVRPATE